MTASGPDIEHKRQRVLAQFGEFALQSDDLDAVLTEACRLVSEALGTERAKVLEIETEAQSLFVRAGVGWAPGIVGRLRLPMSEHSSEAFSIRERMPVIMQDVRRETRFELAAFLKEAGVVALANVPIILPGGTAYGLLEVDANEPREFGPEDTEFLRTYATLLGGAINRLLATQALRASEERFRTLHAEAERRAAELRAVVESMPDAVYVGGLEGITLANQAALDQLGFSTRAELNRHVTSLVEEIQTRNAETGSPIPVQEQAFARALGGERVVQDVRVRHRLSGEERVVRCAAAPVVIDGQVIAAVAVNTDVTDRRRAEDALRTSEARFRAIVETATDYAIFTTDTEGRIETWPRGAEVVYRWTAEEAVGLPAEVTFTPEDREAGQPQRERQQARDRGQAPDVRWHMRRDGSRVFIDGVTRPLTRPDGVLVGFVKVGQDITDRRAAEERLALATEAADLAIFDVDLATGAIEWDARLRALWGVAADEVISDDRFIAGVHPEDREHVRAAVGQALDPEGQHLYRADYRVLRCEDGDECWIAARGRVYFDRNRAVRLVGTVQDITARKRAESALQESETRFRQFGDATGDVLWIRNAKTLAFEYVSPAVEEAYGIRAETLLRGNHMLRWLEMVAPEDRHVALSHIRQAREGEPVLNTFRIRRPSDGAVRWIRDTGFPLRDTEGKVQRIGGIGHDATEEVELQDRLRVLVAELQHRTRNLMGVVRTVTDKTLGSSTSLADFQGRIRDRLSALARVNSLLSRLDGGSRITFGELILTELMAHGVVDPDDPISQVRLRGPNDIRLRSSTVQTLALGLHELATNALKYGALSRPDGRLEVTWALLNGPGREPRLRVEWRERGVRVVAAAQDEGVNAGAATPLRRGYGRELIERALPYQLKAETHYELTPEGVSCTITLPVSSAMGETGLAPEGLDA